MQRRKEGKKEVERRGEKVIRDNETEGWMKGRTEGLKHVGRRAPPWPEEGRWWRQSMSRRKKEGREERKQETMRGMDGCREEWKA